MDLTAITLCMERKIPVVVFNLKVPGNIARVCAARRSGLKSFHHESHHKRDRMPSDDILLDCEEAMDKTLEHLRHELRGLRTGRATPALVENIKVDYYGTPTELRPISAISVPEATQILIKPFSPGDLKAIEKAVNDSKIGLTPHSDGKTLRLILPALSQERRQQLVGQAKGFGEEAKIRIRNSRRDANKLADTEGKGAR